MRMYISQSLTHLMENIILKYTCIPIYIHMTHLSLHTSD